MPVASSRAGTSFCTDCGGGGCTCCLRSASFTMMTRAATVSGDQSAAIEVESPPPPAAASAGPGHQCLLQCVQIGWRRRALVDAIGLLGECLVDVTQRGKSWRAHRLAARAHLWVRGVPAMLGEAVEELCAVFARAVTKRVSGCMKGSFSF